MNESRPNMKCQCAETWHVKKLQIPVKHGRGCSVSNHGLHEDVHQTSQWDCQWIVVGTCVSLHFTRIKLYARRISYPVHAFLHLATFVHTNGWWQWTNQAKPINEKHTPTNQLHKHRSISIPKWYFDLKATYNNRHVCYLMMIVSCLKHLLLTFFFVSVI